MTTGPTRYLIIQGEIERGQFEHLRATDPKWDDGQPWESHVNRVVGAIRDRFRPNVDMSKVNDCIQRSGESVTDYSHRLEETCQAHSGLEKPAGGWGATEGPFEALFKCAFVNGLSEPIRKAVQTSLIGGWSRNRYQDCRRHAQHAEAQGQIRQTEQEATKHKLMLTALQSQIDIARFLRDFAQQRGRGQHRGRGPSHGRRDHALGRSGQDNDALQLRRSWTLDT
ncbi:uncharacterized protein LOC143010109 [Genypterus blacodes]|uniref:uncharacterized protein LOC143010109 n=1 Tax=Genypterus blacodes TaxID=154954 RepID=UPI003F7579AE